MSGLGGGGSISQLVCFLVQAPTPTLGITPQRYSGPIQQYRAVGTRAMFLW